MSSTKKKRRSKRSGSKREPKPHAADDMSMMPSDGSFDERA